MGTGRGQGLAVAQGQQDLAGREQLIWALALGPSRTLAPARLAMAGGQLYKQKDTPPPPPPPHAHTHPLPSPPAPKKGDTTPPPPPPGHLSPSSCRHGAVPQFPPFPSRVPLPPPRLMGTSYHPQSTPPPPQNDATGPSWALYCHTKTIICTTPQSDPPQPLQPLHSPPRGGDLSAPHPCTPSFCQGN